MNCLCGQRNPKCPPVPTQAQRTVESDMSTIDNTKTNAVTTSTPTTPTSSQSSVGVEPMPIPMPVPELLIGGIVGGIIAFLALIGIVACVVWRVGRTASQSDVAMQAPQGQGNYGPIGIPSSNAYSDVNDVRQ